MTSGSHRSAWKLLHRAQTRDLNNLFIQISHHRFPPLAVFVEDVKLRQENTCGDLGEMKVLTDDPVRVHRLVRQHAAVTQSVALLVRFTTGRRDHSSLARGHEFHPAKAEHASITPTAYPSVGVDRPCRLGAILNQKNPSITANPAQLVDLGQRATDMHGVLPLSFSASERQLPCSRRW